jgi:tripartite-type tricarboxylate transporter receptor subunit TctC
MPTDRRRLIIGGMAFAGAAGAAPFVATRARAQSFPARPVRTIVAYAPGGATDVVARLIIGKIGEQLGKQFYVENLAGGSGNIGMAQAAKAAPDGYTMLAAFSSFVVNPTLFRRVPYNPENDFDPVSLAVTSTTVMVVNPSLPAKSMRDLVALVRARPGTYSYASAGTGTQSHLVGEQVRLELGLDMVHVPFNGGAPSMASVVGGHTPIGFGAPAVIVPLAADGQLRALAVASHRTPTLPDIPTMTEAGYPGIEGDSWVGFVVPAGTLKEVVGFLNFEIVKSLEAPNIKARLAGLGYDPVASTPEEFGRRIKSELVTWAKVIKAANIPLQ